MKKRLNRFITVSLQMNLHIKLSSLIDIGCEWTIKTNRKKRFLGLKVLLILNSIDITENWNIISHILLIHMRGHQFELDLINSTLNMCLTR